MLNRDVANIHSPSVVSERADYMMKKLEINELDTKTIFVEIVRWCLIICVTITFEAKKDETILNEINLYIL